MNSELLALDIGGRRIDLGSLTDVRVKVAGDHWNVSFRLDRGGTLDQFLLTTTGDLDSEVQVRYGGRPLAGHGHVAQYNAPGCNTIEVWIVGDSALSRVPEADSACDAQPESTPDSLLADGWREIEGQSLVSPLVLAIGRTPERVPRYDAQTLRTIERSAAK